MKITALSYYKEFLINRKIWAQKNNTNHNIKVPAGQGDELNCRTTFNHLFKEANFMFNPYYFVKTNNIHIKSS